MMMYAIAEPYPFQVSGKVQEILGIAVALILCIDGFQNLTYT